MYEKKKKYLARCLFGMSGVKGFMEMRNGNLEDRAHVDPSETCEIFVSPGPIADRVRAFIKTFGQEDFFRVVDVQSMAKRPDWLEGVPTLRCPTSGTFVGAEALRSLRARVELINERFENEESMSDQELLHALLPIPKPLQLARSAPPTKAELDEIMNQRGMLDIGAENSGHAPSQHHSDVNKENL